MNSNRLQLTGTTCYLMISRFEDSHPHILILDYSSMMGKPIIAKVLALAEYLAQTKKVATLKETLAQANLV